MIDPDSLCPIGVITKAHGLRGEVMCLFDDECYVDAVTDHLLLTVDGIPVPFFITERRQRTARSTILRFDDVDSVEQAAALVGCEVLVERSTLDGNEEDRPSLRQFIGYAVEDTEAGRVGEIVDVDDQTANLLFIVQTASGDELLIPAHPDLIAAINPDAGFITMRLPEGLLDPASAEETPINDPL